MPCDMSTSRPNHGRPVSRQGLHCSMCACADSRTACVLDNATSQTAIL